MARFISTCLASCLSLACLVSAARSSCAPQTSDIDFSLRGSFSDLGPMTCTHDLISARGATFSATNNLLTGQYSASVDGLAALAYRYYGPGDLIGYSLGPYAQGDDSYQLDPTKTQAKNGYTVTTGGFGEIALYDPFTRSVQGIDDFRIRGGDVSSGTGTTSTTVVGEWMPSYALGRFYNIGLPNEAGNTALYYTFAPELMAQYDRFEQGPNNFLIFSSRGEALRIGPQVVLTLEVDKNRLPADLPSPMRDALGNMSALITNHESWDDYTGREYSWTAVSLNYTFPGYNNQPSHLGLSATYGFGNSEASGNKSNQIRLGLAAKL
jgi:hypothetical protein